MKYVLLWVFVGAVVVLGIAGIIFLAGASEARLMITEARTASLVAGITCLVLASGLLVLGVFAFRKAN
jgi:hypothetical protein